MKEIEVKILEVDKEEVIKKLKELGAKKVFDGKIKTSYFDSDDEWLKRDGKVLRLREKGRELKLTIKKGISKEEAKIMEEFEVGLDEFEPIKNILNGLGLKEIQKIVKHRASYVLGDMHFEFDTHTGIPTFLEIEGPSLEKVKDYVEILGYSMEDTKPWSVWDVLEYYEKE